MSGEPVRAHPESGAPDEAGTRRLLTRRFPYSIVYLAEPDCRVVIAVAHHRRKPHYGSGRI